MSHVLNELERYRKTKIIMYLSITLLFISVFFINNLLINMKWLNSLIIIDNCIVFIINILFIELKIGNRYRDLYYNTFMVNLIKSVDQGYEYERCPFHSNYDIYNNKLYEYDASSEIDHIIRLNKLNKCYELMDIKLYINTYRSHKILLFKGYILSFNNKNKNYNNELLILNNKKPLFGDFKLRKGISTKEYKIYSLTEELPKQLINELIILLTKYFEKGKKFNIYIGEYIVIFNRSYFSIFRLPLFKKIDHNFFENKKLQIIILMNMLNEFINCFENNT